MELTHAGPSARGPPGRARDCSGLPHNAGEHSKGEGGAKVLLREANLLDAGLLLMGQGRQVLQRVQRTQSILNAMDMTVAGPVPSRIDKREHPDLATLERIAAVTAGRLVACGVLDGRDPTVRTALSRPTVAWLFPFLPRGPLRTGGIPRKRRHGGRPPLATGPIGHGSIWQGAAPTGRRGIPDLIPSRHGDVPRLARRNSRGVGRRHGLVPRSARAPQWGPASVGVHRVGRPPRQRARRGSS